MRKENSIRIYLPPISQSTVSKIEAQYRRTWVMYVRVVPRQQEPSVGEAQRIINSSRKSGDSSPGTGP
jgi:hypothetical protein